MTHDVFIIGGERVNTVGQVRRSVGRRLINASSSKELLRNAKASISSLSAGSDRQRMHGLDH